MRRRRTRVETRELLLDAAVRVAADRTGENDQHAMNPLAAVRITDALDAVNAQLLQTDPASPRVTSGAAYNIWPSQEAFQGELLDRVLNAASVPEIEQVAAAVERGIHDGLPWPDVVAEGFGLDFDISFAAPTMYTMIGIAALGPVAQVRAAEIAPNERYEQEMTALLRRILQHGDRRLRPGRSMRDLVWAIEAVEVGFLLRRRTHPEVTRRTVAGRTVVQTSIVAVVEAFTEPR